ncbi:MAG: hypothetical protein AAGI91_03325 [Bacteroidota bacterium]
MPTTQKTLLVTTGTGGTSGLNPLNDHLQQGWRVAQVVPMGGAGSGASVRFAALVIIEQDGDLAEQVLEQIEEQIEDSFESQIDEALEGGFAMGAAPQADRPSPGVGWVNPDL